jgi:hypothetical protein
MIINYIITAFVAFLAGEIFTVIALSLAGNPIYTDEEFTKMRKHYENEIKKIR